MFFLTKSKLSTKSTTWRLLVVFAFLLGWVILLSATPNIALGVAAALRTTFLVIGNVLVTILGWGISLVLPVLVNVAQFNDFVNNPAVVNGWKLMRDICNMFFIVIMLIISVGTVLNIQGYTYKNYLKKILLAAVLINFSKTISGLLIDISQIIMLTFVSAFKDSLAVGITQAFHLNQFSQLTQSTDPVTGEVSSGVMESIFASVLVTVMAAIILVVLIAMVVMFVIRIVTLWILVVMSPFAYLASALPGSLSSQSGTWWKQFTQQLLAGPAMAFFLWLTLSVISVTNNDASNSFYTSSSADTSGGVIGSALSDAGYLLNYLIGIAMLIIGMKMAQQLGGAGAAVFGKALTGLKSFPKAAMKGAAAGASFGWDKAMDARAKKKGFENRAKMLESNAMNGKNPVGRLLAARGLDQRKKRDDRRKDWQEKNLGLGTESAKTLARGKQLREEKVAIAAKNKAVAAARTSFDDPSNLAFAVGETQKELNVQRREAESRATNEAKKEWTDKTEAQKNAFMTANGIDLSSPTSSRDAQNLLISQTKTKMTAKFNPNDPNYANTMDVARVAARDRYASAAGREAESRARTDYQKRFLTNYNPLSPTIERGMDLLKGEQEAETLGNTLETNPEKFALGDFVDRKGKVKQGTVAKAFKKMTKPGMQKLLDYHKARVVAGEENADKEYGELLLAFRYMAEKKKGGNANVADLYKSNNLASEIIKTSSGKMERLDKAPIEKSKDFMTDADLQRTVHTATEIENEVTHLSDKEIVKNAAGEDGWRVDQNATNLEADQISLQKDGQTQMVNRNDFMHHNASLLSNHFLKSSRYEEIKRDKGEDYLLNEAEFKEYAQIRQSSQSGVTLGSLDRGGKTAAVSFDQLDAALDQPLVGEQRKAGLFVRGGEAVRAAGGLQNILQEQVASLQAAETGEDIRKQLETFGRSPQADADQSTLERMKQETITKAQAAIDNLGDSQKIERDGLMLLNKTRATHTGRSLDRHEQAHELLSRLDPNGQLQEGIWQDMNQEEQTRALAMIREKQGNPEMSIEEAKKEYVAEAVANHSRPINREKVWQQLSADEQREVVAEVRENNDQPEMSDEEAKKLYLDNVVDMSGRFAGQPLEGEARLSETSLSRLRLAKDQGQVDSREVSSRLTSFITRKAQRANMTLGRKGKELGAAAGAAGRKVGGLATGMTEKLEANRQARQDERTKKQQATARSEWEQMGKEEKKEFMHSQGKNYQKSKDGEASKLYQESRTVKLKVQPAMSQIKKGGQADAEEERLAERKGDIDALASNIVTRRESGVKSYNASREQARALNERAASLEKEAKRAEQDYRSSGNKEGRATWEDKTKQAQDLRRQAQAIIQTGEQKQQVEEKEIQNLENQLASNRAEYEREKKNLDSLKNESTTTAKAVFTAPAPKTTSSDVKPPVIKQAEKVENNLQSENVSREDLIENLQAIQDELDQPESGLDSGELAQLIAVVRDLVSALKGQAGETVSGGMKERVGLALQPLLKSVGSKSNPQDKRSPARFGAPAAGQPKGGFLDQPLNMRQFLLFKKWFEKQNQDLSRLGSGQTNLNDAFKKRMNGLGAALNQIDVDQDEPVDLEVMLREQSFDDDQIQEIVEKYLANQANKE